MATVGAKLKQATKNLVQENVWMDSCPKEASLDEWIVFYSVNSSPDDHGDDMDLEWQELISVHYLHKGNVNYYEMRNNLRKALRDAGFSLGPVQAYYDGEDKRTKVVQVCSVVEEGVLY